MRDSAGPDPRCQCAGSEAPDAHSGTITLACDDIELEVERRMTTSDGSRKKIHVGVLIIGSLYWEDKNGRKEWRRERLVDLDDRKHVYAPIRYGRLSRKSRGCSYTMVFSKQLDDPSVPGNYGYAIVVPCKAPVNSVDDLVDEARHLWRAEGGKRNTISAEWGCVALLENPRRPMPDDLRTGWKEHIRQEPCYGALNSATGELTVVDKSGFLTTSWPRNVAENGSDLEVDVLLATATNPTIVGGNYPSAREIAAAWNAHGGEDYKRYVKYFRQNRHWVIRTFQDSDIEKLLRSP